MKTFPRHEGARLYRRDAGQVSAYALVPHETHFGELCGFADEVVAAGHGFGLRPHRDMEISTVMLRGAQRHADSTGDAEVLDEHAVQTVSAGTGLRHCQVNASAMEPSHSLQIWIHPRERGAAPRRACFGYRPEDKRNRLLLAVSPDGRDGTARIGQDAFLSVARLDAGSRQRYAVHLPGNGAYVHCAAGAAAVAGQHLGPGDAVGVYEAASFVVEPLADAELVVVEVPMTRGIRP